MEMIGLPNAWVVRLLAAALGKIVLSKADAAQASDQLARLLPLPPRKAVLDQPTGTAETVTMAQELHQASSVSASPSWSISHS